MLYSIAQKLITKYMDFSSGFRNFHMKGPSTDCLLKRGTHSNHASVNPYIINQILPPLNLPLALYTCMTFLFLILNLFQETHLSPDCIIFDKKKIPYFWSQLYSNIVQLQCLTVQGQ